MRNPRCHGEVSNHAEVSRRRTIAVFLAFFIALVASVGAARAQDTAAQDAMGTMKQLQFLNGAWRCTVQGGPTNGQIERLNYTFSGDGRWLIERADIQGAPNASSVQVIGYDPAQRKVVANEYTASGISTKTVQGWITGQFAMTRDDNHYQVVLQQNNPNSFTWTVHPTGLGATPIVEACTR